MAYAVVVDFHHPASKAPRKRAYLPRMQSGGSPEHPPLSKGMAARDADGISVALEGLSSAVVVTLGSAETENGQPGNVRELVQVVEPVAVLVHRPADLPPPLQPWAMRRGPRFPLFHLRTVVAEAERQTLQRALRQTQGNRDRAAQLVGVSRASFYRKLRAYGLMRGRPNPKVGRAVVSVQESVAK